MLLRPLVSRSFVVHSHLNAKSLSTMAHAGPQIRFMQSQDQAAWQGLWEQYNDFYKRTIPKEVTSTTFARMLDDKVRMYGAVALDATENDKVIGFNTWYPHPSTSSIQEVVYAHDMFVDPTIRNKGVGRSLLEFVFEHARRIPAASVYWHTQYYNYRAQLLYTKVADRTDFVVYRKTF